MLLSFSVGNFRSFAEEQEFSMVASNRYTDHREHLCPVPNTDELLLRAAVIYGANGSGKSNFIKALRFVRTLVMEGTPPNRTIARQPFLLSRPLSTQPSSFRVRFVDDPYVFDYGFKITDHDVTEEWLFISFGQRETKLFERASEYGGTRIEPGAGLTEPTLGDHSKIVAFSRVGVRANQLFLTAIRDNLNEADYGPIIQKVLKWFLALEIVTPDATYISTLANWVSSNSTFTDFASRFLRDASTGVSALQVETRELTEGSSFPLDLAKKVLADSKPGESKLQRIPGLGNVVLQRGEDGQKIFIKTIRTDHLDDSGTIVPFPLSEESDGTQRLTHLLPALFLLQDSKKIYIIDEIDRSLHPLLAKKFIEFFLRVCVQRQSQLILTTHESNLMDLDILRRDELWFTEKNEKGATTLYSLENFKVRTDLKIDRGYLQGRFGAIPFLANLDKLSAEAARLKDY